MRLVDARRFPTYSGTAELGTAERASRWSGELPILSDIAASAREDRPLSEWATYPSRDLAGSPTTSVP
jgi:hypothetical protein